ncbi:hypothetical protein PR202_gb23181 [Eleusine coracana subsp. coracana]|uniref:Disease resistance protein At4g27190-like leucine-rich repeats domain-containing protein n=1 Tax=Eleusine coracana subsp. coracana TaxID=191504 RepID=A0AAV5FFK9_ELECO|nr:hypothetical protein PR202_gb23181 [Eleusine coracana subsp. coracana]
MHEDSRSISGKDNVIYFDGWDGLGATTVLRNVAQRLAVAVEPHAGLRFDRIIHIDCSKWESKRAVQRAIAEQLKLPDEVMEMLDQQDEEDDYHGLEQGSRAEVPQVVREIYQSIQNSRFLVIFFNGSNEEIDLTNLGFHLYSSNKVLWTFQGSLRLMSKKKIDGAMKTTTGTVFAPSPDKVCQDHAMLDFANIGVVQIIPPIPSENIFRHYDELRVLKLSCCSLSLSLPFLCCRNLRFLWLDQCQDIVLRNDGAAEKEKIHQCFERLWVFDVRYTRCERSLLSAPILDLMTQLRELIVVGGQGWDIGQLRGRLPNIRKLRVSKSTIRCSSSSWLLEKDLFSRMNKMELLEFSGNRIMSGMTSLPMASNRLLETITMNEGCAGLGHILLRGCSKLKNVLLGGSFIGLNSIDISGTAVKMLDLSAVSALILDELIALDCDKLCAILWPPEEKRRNFLSKLRIDTTMESSTNATSGSSWSSLLARYNWYISLNDARLLQSLVPFKSGTKEERIIKSSGQVGLEYLQKQQQLPEISNPSVCVEVAITLKNHMRHISEGDDDDAPTITETWPCPHAPNLNPEHCYMYIQDQPVRNRLPKRARSEFISTGITVPDMICDNTSILHVHDSKSITRVPGPAPPVEGARWNALKWCRVERCPSLDCVFTCPSGSNDMIMFTYLATLWSSQLLKVHCIWDVSRPSSVDFYSFQMLKFVHLDLCPRLTHMLPLSSKTHVLLPLYATVIHETCLGSLETLEILWCGNLRAVFPLDTYTEGIESCQDQQQQHKGIIVKFPHLKRIHLHELPMLQGICGSGRIYAPELESIKIRGCWSLMCLPILDKNKVECDCEKEWWDRLQWDRMDINHRPSLYKPIHPRYYKKTFLRGSLLR